MPDRLSKIPGTVVKLVNGIPSFYIILALLLLFFQRFDLNGNEEHYLVLAKQFAAPSWVPDSFTFSEFAGTRVLYQYLVGYTLNYLSFEATVALYRFLLSVAFALVLAKIYKELALANAFIVLHLGILYLAQGKYIMQTNYNQSFFGGEWIFLSVEPKVFAYIFVLYALYYLLKERYNMVAAFLAAASYFHILVGGWVMAYFLLYQLVSARSFKRTFFSGLLYLVILLPFLIYLAPIFEHNFAGSGQAAEQVDWIFTYFKQPYHTAIFSSLKYFYHVAFEGVLISSFFFLMCVLAFSNFKNHYNQKLNLLNILIFAGTIASVGIAFFDRSGAFVKYFPFRINAIYCFTIYLQLALIIQHYIFKGAILKYVQFAIILWFVLVSAPKPVYAFFRNTQMHFAEGFNPPAYNEVCRYVQTETPKGSTLLFLPDNAAGAEGFSFDGSRSMVRDTERDRYVYFFAAPVSPDTEKTLEWHRRVKLKRQIVEGRSSLCRTVKGENIDYILTDAELHTGNCFNLRYSNDTYYLYQLNKDTTTVYEFN